MVLAALSFAVLIPNHPAGRDPAEDTGVFFYAAQRLLDGGMPYRDIWDHKPPGVYLVDALGLAIGRETGVWLVQLAFLAVAAVLGHRALQREFGDVPALVGSVAWLLALPRLFLAEETQTSFVEFYALPLQFGALLLFSSEIRTPTTVRAVAIGVLGGAALLFKPTLIGVWVTISVITLVHRRRRAVAPLALIAIGAILPLAIVVAWAAARGVLSEMVDQALAYNRAYAAFAPLGDRIAAVLAGLRLTLPSGLALIAIGAWLYAVLTRRTSPALTRVALLAFPLEIALSTWGRGYHYYFIPWLPPMAILTAFAVSEVQRIVPGRVRVALAAAVLLMCVQPVLLVMRLAMSTGDGQSRAAAAYIAANTRPEDTVLIWGSHSEVLFLADRVSPSRYVYQYAALATRGYATPARALELLRDLERARPLLIFDASGNSFVTPPLDPAGWRAWVSPEPQYAPLPELERVLEFVLTNYDRAGSEPSMGWPMWKLRTP